MKFPKDVSLIIVDYARIWTIAPWVPEPEYIRTSGTWDMNMIEVRRAYLNQNPKSKDVIEDFGFCIEHLMKNPADWAVDICEPKYSPENMKYMYENPNPRAVKYISDHFGEIPEDDNHWFYLLKNPGAVDLIKDRWNEVPHHKMPIICGNNNDDIRDLMKECWYCQDDDWWVIAKNTSSWGIEYLQTKTYQELCDMDSFYANCHPWAIEKINAFVKNNYDNVSWCRLSQNSAAGHILQKHPDKLYSDIWKNPCIFELTERSGLADIISDLRW